MEIPPVPYKQPVPDSKAIATVLNREGLSCAIAIAETPEIAAFIARACNHHQRLIDLLTNISEWIDTGRVAEQEFTTEAIRRSVGLVLQLARH